MVGEHMGILENKQSSCNCWQTDESSKYVGPKPVPRNRPRHENPELPSSRQSAVGMSMTSAGQRWQLLLSSLHTAKLHSALQNSELHNNPETL